jgi:chromosomal replication initiation ATPase DnaA
MIGEQSAEYIIASRPTVIQRMTNDRKAQRDTHMVHEITHLEQYLDNPALTAVNYDKTYHLCGLELEAYHRHALAGIALHGEQWMRDNEGLVIQIENLRQQTNGPLTPFFVNEKLHAFLTSNELVEPGDNQ